MIIASKINNKYELGDKLIIPITEDDYNKLKEIGHEKTHLLNHKFIIISEDGGFTKEVIKECNDKIKAYYNKNKLNIKVEENN